VLHLSRQAGAAAVWAGVQSRRRSTRCLADGKEVSMINTKATKGRMTLREAVQGGGRATTTVERSKTRPRDQPQLVLKQRSHIRLDRTPIRLTPVRIRLP
jgi:hypothetical protein